MRCCFLSLLSVLKFHFAKVFVIGQMFSSCFVSQLLPCFELKFMSLFHHLIETTTAF